MVMNRKFSQRLALGIVLVLSMGLMAIAVAAQDAATDASGAAATLQNANGETVGPVTLTSFNNNKIVLTAQFAGLPPGFHGFHVHSVGSCEDSGAGLFSAAGDHLNPTGASHPDHVGDLPSLLVHQDGTAYLSLTTDRFTIADLFDADGSALIIHANPDNFANVPERFGAPDQETLAGGDSGEHIACGVLMQVGAMPADAMGAATAEATAEMAGVGEPTPTPSG
ncbi:MAG: superoxide dismutase family protein [Chloroflexi bacterium]|nr:superoxide dismutase family protein [Chloroflexota bacterium]